jgi:hypothetical protein
MGTAQINLDDFVLPFIKRPDENYQGLINMIIEKIKVKEPPENEDEENLNAEDDESSSLSEMEEQLPKNAIFLGSVEEELNNAWCQLIHDEYYIIKLENERYNWALFRISWDDNNSKWNWMADARLEGDVNDYKEAAIMMLTFLWDKWGDIDYSDKSGSEYAGLISRLR